MNKKHKIGIDFGGSHFGVIITDEDGNVIAKNYLNVDLSNITNQTEKENRIMDTIIPIIETCIVDSKIDRTSIDFMGIGVPGSCKDLKIVYLPNIGLKDFDIGSAFKHRFNILGLQENQVKIILENDANCAAVGEGAVGALKNVQNGINIVFGTGVGAGVILNGKLYKGENNCAGEIGHLTIDKYSNIKCGCGRNGCLETLCSVKRLRENVSNILNLNVTIDGVELVGVLNKVFGQENERIIYQIQKKSSQVLELLNERNSNQIKELYEEFKENLVIGLVSVINAFDPQKISVGGSLSYFIEPNLEEITGKVNKECFYKQTDNTSNYEIVKATLENDAGLIGAAMLEKY